MSSPEQRAIARELARRKRLPAAVASLEASLFAAQAAFVNDPAKRVVSRAGRRGGKTWGLATIAMREATKRAGTTVPVIERTLTCAAARELWKALKDLNERFKLGARFHESFMLCTLPNRSEILIAGADTIEAADKLRGGKYPAALLDEAGTFRDHVLRYLVNEVLGPALFDFGGRLFVAGTPAVRKSGWFYEASTGALDGWSQHHWNFRSNPHIPYDVIDAAPYTPEQREAAREAEFLSVIRDLGHSVESPFVQREWFGEWVSDTDSLAWMLSDDAWKDVRTPADVYNPVLWLYGLGIDPGFNDPTAFVVAARHRVTRQRVVLESYEQAGILPSAVPGHVVKLRERYPFTFIVVDTGGYGKGSAEEMLQSQWGLPVVAARKRGKELHRTFANDGLRSGNIRLVEATNRELIADMQVLRKNADGTDDARDSNHLSDAFLYLMHHMHTLSSEKGPGAKHERGSPEWLAALEARIEAGCVAGLSAPTGDPGMSEAVGQLHARDYDA